MYERCEVCNLKFEREPGYFLGAMYISYGLGLTLTLNTVKLRYTLGDHWMIRTEAGQVGGADLVYTLDK